ncbi:MAG: potassium channel family protein [Actinomycetota bacterium]|nr:potassium channel family protein [Actinomycetota bacterium]
MTTSRLEAFSDAVIAIIITIMVLELHVPDGSHWDDVRPLVPVFLSYVLSFVILGIYWNNHHHLLQATERINGRVLWANLHLLFWLSLFPFGTAWMGENHLDPLPTATYGAILLLAAISYYVLQTVITREQPEGSTLRTALGRDLKGKSSPVIYLAAIPLAFVSPVASLVLFVGVALMWLVPDRRLEAKLNARD